MPEHTGCFYKLGKHRISIFGISRVSTYFESLLVLVVGDRFYG